MFRLLVIASLSICGWAAVIDRIAITVGPQVITEQQLDEEIRVTAFLNREKLTRTIEARRAAADHLVQQLLVRREMELSRYPLPEDQDVDKYFAEVRGGFGTAPAFAQELAQYNLTQEVLKEHLALQLTTLRFIQFRFRPEIGISDSDIRTSYEHEVTAWRADHPGSAPPSLAASRESIRSALLEERTDEVLNTWLEESRKQVNIVYLDKELR